METDETSLLYVRFRHGIAVRNTYLCMHEWVMCLHVMDAALSGTSFWCGHTSCYRENFTMNVKNIKINHINLPHYVN